MIVSPFNVPQRTARPRPATTIPPMTTNSFANLPVNTPQYPAIPTRPPRFPRRPKPRWPAPRTRPTAPAPPTSAASCIAAATSRKASWPRWSNCWASGPCPTPRAAGPGRRVRPRGADGAGDRLRHGRDHREDRAGASGRQLPGRGGVQRGRGFAAAPDRGFQHPEPAHHPARRGGSGARHDRPRFAGRRASISPTRGPSAITSAA